MARKPRARKAAAPAEILPAEMAPEAMPEIVFAAEPMLEPSLAVTPATEVLAATQLALPAVLDMRAAAPLAAAILDHRGGALTLDGAAVQRLGGQCLQVLLAAEASWAADGHDFALADPSPELISSLVLLGVAPGSALLPQETPA